MRIVDLQLNIDGLVLDDDESVEEFVKSLHITSIYPVIWEVLSDDYG